MELTCTQITQFMSHIYTWINNIQQWNVHVGQRHVTSVEKWQVPIKTYHRPNIMGLGMFFPGGIPSHNSFMLNEYRCDVSAAFGLLTRSWLNCGFTVILCALVSLFENSSMYLYTTSTRSFRVLSLLRAPRYGNRLMLGVLDVCSKCW